MLGGGSDSQDVCHISGLVLLLASVWLSSGKFLCKTESGSFNSVSKCDWKIRLHWQLLIKFRMLYSLAKAINVMWSGAHWERSADTEWAETWLRTIQRAKLVTPEIWLRSVQITEPSHSTCTDRSGGCPSEFLPVNRGNFPASYYPSCNSQSRILCWCV